MKESLIIEGDVARCPSCGHIAVKSKEGNYNSFCEKCGKDFLVNEEQGDRIGKEKSSPVSITGLSLKYEVLEIYQSLAYLLMFVNTGYFIFSLVQIIDTMGNNAGSFMLPTIITYVITMFSLFCLTKMIDFLFDLDKKN